MKHDDRPDACSLSPDSLLRELGLPLDAVLVDLVRKSSTDGRDFRAINPKGHMPVLELDDGSVLTESQVIVQDLADRKPEAAPAPANGTLARHRARMATRPGVVTALKAVRKAKAG